MKHGIHYFILQCDFLLNARYCMVADKVAKKKIASRNDFLIFCVFLKSYIFRKAHYVKLDDEFYYAVDCECRLTKESAIKLLKIAAAEGLIDKDLYAKKVITSTELQKDYFTVTSRDRRRTKPSNPEYLLVDLDNFSWFGTGRREVSTSPRGSRGDTTSNQDAADEDASGPEGAGKQVSELTVREAAKKYLGDRYLSTLTMLGQVLFENNVANPWHEIYGFINYNHSRGELPTDDVTLLYHLTQWIDRIDAKNVCRFSDNNLRLIKEMVSEMKIVNVPYEFRVGLLLDCSVSIQGQNCTIRCTGGVKDLLEGQHQPAFTEALKKVFKEKPKVFYEVVDATLNKGWVTL